MPSWKAPLVGPALFSFLFLAPFRAFANPYNATQIEVESIDNGLDQGDVAWGDYDNDGDLDILTCGQDQGNNEQLRVYTNTGAGFSATQIEVDGANGGLIGCGLAWGDYDNDGDLDILAVGRDSGNQEQLRVYRNTGGAFDVNQIEVDGANGGLFQGDAAWGDFDNDGDLDILTAGQDSANAEQLRVYRNNGNDTFDANQIEVEAANGGFIGAGVTWADFDNDGDLDILSAGRDSANNEQLRVYRNNGDGTFNAAQIEIDGANGGLFQGRVAWGDYDADGDLDILAAGQDTGGLEQLRVYANNGNGTFNAAQIEIDGGNGGLMTGGLAWGDTDNDGDLDILASGLDSAGARQLRVYLNNGNGTFNAAQVEIDGATNGLAEGGVAWGDYNNDGRIDILVNGRDSSAAPNEQLRVYANTAVTANTAPNAPGGLSAVFTYAASPAISTVAFQWNPATDAGGAGTQTPQNVLTYDIQVSTINNNFASGPYVFPSMLGASPRRGAYYRPPVIGGKHTVYLKSTSPLDPDLAPYGLQASTTYYFRVRTVDAGLMMSTWSAAGSVFTGVPPQAATLAVAAAATDGQIVLNWNAPTGALGGTYDVRWSLSAITSDALFNAASPLTGEPAPAAAGTAQTLFVRGVPPEQTVFFAMKTTSPGGTSALSNSPSGTPLAFDRTQIEVGGGADAGLMDGDVAWGDMDNDGLWDIVAMGMDAGAVRRLRVYRNDGAGGFVNPPLELPFLANGNVALGDFDGDDDVDILATGNDGTAAPNRQLRIFVNASTPGNLSFPSTVDVPGAADQGFDFIGEPAPGGGCGLEWADMNNDGDLDVVACGTQETTGVAQLYIYFNNGNGTFASPQDVPTSGDNFYIWGDLAVSDFDHNGFKDIVAMGYTSTGGTPITGHARRLAVHYNQGGNPPTFTETILAGEELSSGAMAVGDANNDGWADLVVQGFNGNRQLRFCRNNNGLFDTGAFPCTNVEGGNIGLNRGELAWGDYNNDGDLDILSQGGDDSTNGDGGEIRLYAGNGDGTFGARVNVENPNGGMMNEGAVAWGDFDDDGDVDVVVTGSDQYGAGGSPQLRVYVNYWSATPGAANTPPTAPTVLATDFLFSPTASSTATFKWDPATDDITPPVGLQYKIQVATTTPLYSYNTPLAINTPSPQYFPQIYDGNTRHGTVLVSTNPWDPQSGTLTGLLTDTTYYFHVRTVDAGLMESGWSTDVAASILWTGVAPSTSTVGAGSGFPGQATMTWTSAGDDQYRGDLTGSYRIQYSTSPSVAWSTSTTPTGAFTSTISTAAQTPGSAQTVLFTGLTEGTSYYFRLWTQDDAGLWSAISNQTTAYVLIATRDLVLSTGAYNFGTVGLSQSTQSLTGVTVTYTGTTNSTYRLYASTITPGGSPWAPAAAPGVDLFRLYAGFNATQPALGAFGGEDVLLVGSQACTATAFALGQTCLNVTTGTALPLWFRLDMPTVSSDGTAGEQRIQVTVEAGPP
jgi:hypothetical protein